MDGVALQLVYEDEEGNLKYNADIADRILGHEDVRNRKAAVISITGSERGGKSFLLNYVLRYLANEEQINQFGSPDHPLNGFPSKNGTDRQTRGILVWSTPFIRTLDNGEEVAIILLDTQGLFGISKTNDAYIFAFCALVSSIQIYNAKGEFLSNSLELLNILFRYAFDASTDEISKVFQKLTIIVRDWSLNENFGFGGGNEHISKLLMANRDIASQFSTCFYENLSCYLMCNPGDRVSSINFMGSLNELRDLFSAHLKDFIKTIVNECKPKKIAHYEVNGERLCRYFKVCFDKIIKNEPLKYINETYTESICDKIIKELRDIYHCQYKVFVDQKINQTYLEALEGLKIFAPKRKELFKEAEKDFLLKVKLPSNLYEKHLSSFTYQLGQVFNNVDELMNKTLIEKTIRLLGHYYCKTMKFFSNRNFFCNLKTSEKEIFEKHKSIISVVKEEFSNLDEDSLNWCISHLRRKLIFSINKHRKKRKKNTFKVVNTGIVASLSGASVAFHVATIAAVSVVGGVVALAAVIERAIASSVEETAGTLASAGVKAGPDAKSTGIIISELSGAVVLRVVSDFVKNQAAINIDEGADNDPKVDDVTDAVNGVTDNQNNNDEKDNKEPNPEIIFILTRALTILIKNYLSVGGKISDLIIDEGMPTL